MADRASQPTVYRYAIFVKIRKNGKTVYNRRPYDVVELDWCNGERYPYIQPLLGGVPAAGTGTALPASVSASLYRTGTAGGEAQEVVYDDIRIYSSFPDFDLCHADHSMVSKNPADQPRGFITV
jgi:hypothetical protein